MILLYQLDTVRAENYARANEQNYLNLKQLNLDRQRMAYKLLNNHILDSSGQYNIINNLLKPPVGYEDGNPNDDNQNHPNANQNNPNADPQQDGLPNKQSNNFQESNLKLTDLTLITQCSASRLYYIEDLLNAYHGPVSLALFTLSKDIPELIRVLMLLRKCLPLFRNYVRVHLVYPLAPDSLSVRMPTIDLHNLTCSTLRHQLVALRKHKEEHKTYGDGVQYPGNLLRNVARKNAPSSYVLVLDIDLIPSKSLRSDFLHFIRQNRCNKCQRSTNYEEWQLANGPPQTDGEADEENASDELAVLFEIFWQDPYEPFYIAQNSDSLPYYDERFKQYGFNRISQLKGKSLRATIQFLENGPKPKLVFDVKSHSEPTELLRAKRCPLDVVQAVRASETLKLTCAKDWAATTKSDQDQFVKQFGF
ncbi:hypothetical protein L1887_62322 [Cichorium endivia]|nr:hypothetical protein L1887_62322 [Cichorium endivia]